MCAAALLKIKGLNTFTSETGPNHKVYVLTSCQITPDCLMSTYHIPRFLFVLAKCSPFRPFFSKATGCRLVKIWSGDETVFLAACSQQQLSSDCKQWKIVWGARGLLPTEVVFEPG